MNQKLMILFAFSAVLTLVACGGDKPSAGQFTEVCEKVAKCDQDLAEIAQTQGQDAGQVCSKSLADLEARLPDSTGPVVECIQATACEELSFMVCAAKVQDKLQQLVPGAGQ